MLRPTEDEIREATSLGIDYEDMNGPQLREAIARAKRPGVRPSIRTVEACKNIVGLADLLGVDILQGDTVASLKKRIVKRLEAIFEEKGIHPGVVIIFSDQFPARAGQEAVVKSTRIHWFGPNPQIGISSEGKGGKVTAHHVALHARVIG